MGSVFGKTEADWLLKININWLNQRGFLEGVKAGNINWERSSGGKSSVSVYCDTLSDNPSMRLVYTLRDTFTNEKKDINYRIYFTSTPCNYGGKRWWFICPLVKQGDPCKRRVGTLYKGDELFGCRHCYDLTYLSKNINRRGPLASTLEMVDIDTKIGKLEPKIKRRYYAGKPTKNQRKLYKLYEKASRAYNSDSFGKLR